MAVITLGLSHHTAPVEARGRLAFTDAEVPAALVRLKGLAGVREAAILSTCNRTEIVTVAEPEDEARLKDWWRREREVDLALVDIFHQDRVQSDRFPSKSSPKAQLHLLIVSRLLTSQYYSISVGRSRWQEVRQMTLLLPSFILP